MTFDEFITLLNDNNVLYELGDLIQMDVAPNKDLWEFRITVEEDEEVSNDL